MGKGIQLGIFACLAIIAAAEVYRVWPEPPDAFKQRIDEILRSDCK